MPAVLIKVRTNLVSSIPSSVTVWACAEGDAGEEVVCLPRAAAAQEKILECWEGKSSMRVPHIIFLITFLMHQTLINSVPH